MRNYKTAQEQREEAKQGNRRWYRTLYKLFTKNPSMELSVMLSDLALVLVDSFGLTWDEVYALEV